MSLLRTTFVLAALVCSIPPAPAAPANADGPPQAAEETGLRVGTFDSRAVTMAFIRSDMFEKELQRRMAEHKKAKAAGDEE